MSIDKITPNRLDRSSDFKLIPKTSMVDALNMIITEENSSADSDNVGDLGVLKNVKGNSPIAFASLGDAIQPGEAKIIGSVTDTKLKIVYFFVWHDNPDEHGVWAYDPLGKLPGGGNYTNAIRKIHKSNLYNFPQHGFVKGDLIYTSQTRLVDAQIKPGAEKDFEKDTILYFTDNTNEPKKINVSMALMNADSNYNDVDQIDFITACPKTPLTPITFTFSADLSRSVSNFKSGPPFQFAYQYIYKDGVESAISPYSDVAVAPVILGQGTLTNINYNVNNRCDLTIPLAGEEIQSVRILARRDNMPDMVILDQVDWDEFDSDIWDPNTGIYYFYNDRIVKGVSTNEVNKQFDNLPRVAQSQAIVDNRLMYGNYLEGFDNVNTQCTADVIFSERPLDLVNIDMTLVPAISEQLQASSVNQIVDGFSGSEANAPFSEVYGGTINKSAGYILDASNFPDVIGPGITINVSIKLAPDNNFHVYQAQNSYHQSRHKGAWSGQDENIEYTDADTYSGYEYGGFDEAGNFSGAYGHQDKITSGEQWINEQIYSAAIPAVNVNNATQDFTYSYGVPLAGNNRGVGATGIASDVYGTIPMPRWRSLLGLGNDSESYHDVVYGTSAGNPLILKAGEILFEVSLTTNIDFSGGARAAITSSIAQILGGESPTWSGGEAFTVNSVIGPTYEHNINLEIDNFQKFPDTHPYSKLITSAMSKDMLEANPFANPIGHFIVSKAKVTFSMERDEYYSGIPDENGNFPYEMIRLVIDSIDPLDGEDEINAVTVVKKTHPRSPWIALTKDYFTSGGFNITDFEQGTSTNLGEVWTPDTYTVTGVNTITAFGGELDSYGGHIRIYPGEENTMEDFSYKYPEGVISDEGLPYPGYNGGMLMQYCSGRDNGTGSYNNDFYQRNIVENLQVRYFLGYLDFQQSEDYPQFFRYYKSIYQDGVQETPSISDKETFIFSLLDGENGPGGNLGHTEFLGEVSEAMGGPYNANESIINQHFKTSAPRRTFLDWKWSEVIEGTAVTGSTLLVRFGGPFFLGRIDCALAIKTPTHLSHQDENDPTGGYPETEVFGSIGNPRRTYLPQAQGLPEFGTNFLGNYPDITSIPQTHSELFYSSPGDIYWIGGIPGEAMNTVLNFSVKGSHIEIADFLISNLSDIGPSLSKTFKSSANHDFGIIYYDERGRHGFVNHLTTVYVPGYSQSERGGPLHGRSSIKLNIQHSPPYWAYYYKIAYTKNTTVRDFIQYSAGGAYVEENNNSTKIYVSLNYLQESRISYVADWGARDPEGGLSLAQYLDGGNQKVRVISAYTSASTRFFPNNFEFDVIDIVLLGDTDNPLGSDTDIQTKPWLKGEFIVLKNNSGNNGFDHAAVENNSDLWGHRCIFELYTPEKDQDSDERFYYEIGDTYDVFRVDGNTYHSEAEYEEGVTSTSIILDKGDVWWRKVPVNFSRLNQINQTFEGIIEYDASNPSVSSSNFLPYYLESTTASDLFKSDSSTIGRPNLIVEDAIESVREASITYSQQSNPNSSKINYSSFNLTLSNYKDLQEEFGDINYMCNMSGDVFVIQSDKCTLVPASKTLFSDVQGGDTVAASRSPLGQERVFAGRSGCDNNPESAVQVGSYVYFAHKTLGKVFRFNPSNGVQEISDQGMSSYFRDLFKRAMQSSLDINHRDIRVVGGYDPVNDEYLLTVLYELTVEESIPDLVVDDPYIEDEQIVDYDTGGDLTDSVREQQQVFLGRIPEGVEIDVYTSIDTWFELLEGPWNSTLDFGNIERTPSGTEVTRDFYISNMGDEDVFVKILPTNSLTFYANSKYPSQFGNGHYNNPSFKHIKNELGITQVDQFSLEPVKTLIPAGTYHTFTMTINVNEANHPYTGGYSGPWMNISSEEGTQYLIDTFGTTKRALTGSERALGGENVPNEGLAERPYYDGFQATTIEFEVYNMDNNLIWGVDDIGSHPYRRKDWRYQIVDEFEGDVISEGEGGTVVQGGTYSADLDGDGFVSVTDLTQLLSNFGETGENILGDFNNDGYVNVQDLLILFEQFGGDAPNINDVVNVPTLNLDAFANAVIELASLGQYGLTPIDLDSINTYVDFVSVVGEGAVSAILLNQFPEVWNFISGGEDAISVFMQVYLTDDSGNFIPYGSAPETGPPPFDLCAWPILQDANGMVNMASVVSSHAINGYEAFFAGMPISAALYSNYDINQFILAYLVDDNDQPISISCGGE